MRSHTPLEAFEYVLFLDQVASLAALQFRAMYRLYGLDRSKAQPNGAPPALALVSRVDEMLLEDTDLLGCAKYTVAMCIATDVAATLCLPPWSILSRRLLADQDTNPDCMNACQNQHSV